MTLYQRLGGQKAVSLVVEKFYEIMLKDQRVSAYFVNTDMTKQVCRQKQFITLVTGGPNNYQGADMKAAHCKHAIGQFQFDSTWENLQKALDFYGVPSQQKQQLKQIFYSVQDDIVNTKKESSKGKCPFSKQVQKQQKKQEEQYKSLCEKLGGKEAISLVVDKFYEMMLKDERVKDYFSETDMEKQRKSQKQFITMVTGGPAQYNGTDMKTAHCKFAIRQFQFDATWQNLQNALNFYKVPSNYQQELKEIFYSVQDDIVNTVAVQKPISKCPFSQSGKTNSSKKEITQQEKQSDMQKNLFQKLGGKGAIDLVVNKFYDFMLQDNRVKDYFCYTDMQKQRKSQKQFITMVTGGPNQYHGSDMKKAHCQFAIGQFQFDSTWQNLEKALDFYKVQKAYQSQLKQIFYSVQDDIVNSSSKVPLKCPYPQKKDKTIQQADKQNMSSHLPLTHEISEKKCPFSEKKSPLNQQLNSHMKQYFKRKIRLQFLQREEKQGKVPQKLKNTVYKNIFY